MKQLLKLKKIIDLIRDYSYHEERKIMNMAIKHIREIIYTKKQLKNISFTNSDIEFYGFSQGGEDGFVLLLCRLLNIKNGIEFGTEDWKQSNLRLATKIYNLKTGLIDGSIKNIYKIKRSNDYYFNNIYAISSWITEKNILPTIQGLMLKMKIDYLDLISIDIDGNDFYVLKKVIPLKPKVIIIEVNDIYCSEMKASTPYKKDFFRYNFHYSGTIYGASYNLIKGYLEENKYKLFAQVTSGNNLFFVDEDYWEKVEEFSSCELRAFKKFSYRESLDKNGKKNYLDWTEKQQFLEQVKLNKF